MSDPGPTPHAGVEPGWMLQTAWELPDGAVARSLRESDMAALRSWRNTQQAVLRQQAAITEEHQRRWYEDVVEPSYRSTRPSALLVAVAESEHPVAYGGLTNIEWTSRRAEVSFLAETARTRDDTAYAREFGRFLDWLTTFTFETLGFRRLFTETWDFRRHHMSVLEDAGFRPEGRLRQHVVKDGRVHDAVLHGLLWSDERRAA